MDILYIYIYLVFSQEVKLTWHLDVSNVCTGTEWTWAVYYLVIFFSELLVCIQNGILQIGKRDVRLISICALICIYGHSYTFCNNPESFHCASYCPLFLPKDFLSVYWFSKHVLLIRYNDLKSHKSLCFPLFCSSLSQIL